MFNLEILKPLFRRAPLVVAWREAVNEAPKMFLIMWLITSFFAGVLPQMIVAVAVVAAFVFVANWLIAIWKGE